MKVTAKVNELKNCSLKYFTLYAWYQLTQVMRSFDLWILDPRRSLNRPAVEFDLEVIRLDNTKRQIQLLRKRVIWSSSTNVMAEGFFFEHSSPLTEIRTAIKQRR